MHAFRREAGYDSCSVRPLELLAADELRLTAAGETVVWEAARDLVRMRNLA